MRRFCPRWLEGAGHKRRLNASLVNYADDFVICCRGNADEAMAVMRNLMSKLKLTVNEKKTRLCRFAGRDVRFSGLHHRPVLLPEDGRGLSEPETVAEKGQSHLRRDLGALSGRHTTLLSVEKMVAHLNRMLVGWANYFCLGPVSPAYRAIDQHVRRRLRQWLCAKHKVPGPGEARFPDKYLYQTLRLAKLASRTQTVSRAKA